MTVKQTTLAARNAGGRPLERERDESLRVARGIILGLVFSPLFWIVVVVGSGQVAALLGFQ